MHNTPADIQKLKAGLNVSGDGAMPTDYRPWCGRSADLTTVRQNMERLGQLLSRRGWPLQEVLVIGDRANLNDELALAYDAKDLKYLAGLQAQSTEHWELLRALPEPQFVDYPLGTLGYWGRPCQLTFTHHGHSVPHRGLVMLSRPSHWDYRHLGTSRRHIIGARLIWSAQHQIDLTLIAHHPFVSAIGTRRTLTRMDRLHSIRHTLHLALRKLKPSISNRELILFDGPQPAANDVLESDTS